MFRRIVQGLFVLIVLHEVVLNCVITIGVMFGHDDQQFPGMDRWLSANPLGEYALYGCLVLVWGQLSMLSGRRSRAWIGLMAYHAWFFCLGLWCANTDSGSLDPLLGRGHERHVLGWAFVAGSGTALVLLGTSAMRLVAFGLPPLFGRRLPRA